MTIHDEKTGPVRYSVQLWNNVARYYDGFYHHYGDWEMLCPLFDSKGVAAEVAGEVIDDYVRCGDGYSIASDKGALERVTYHEAWVRRVIVDECGEVVDELDDGPDVVVSSLPREVEDAMDKAARSHRAFLDHKQDHYFTVRQVLDGEDHKPFEC